MLGYTTVGTTDLERAGHFYDPLFAKMGFSRVFEDEQVISWGKKDDHKAPRFFVCYPFDDQPATNGNGVMIAFQVETASIVDDLYEIAIDSGGTNEGKPGYRPEQYGDKFYVAYVRDPDGNKLAFACYDGKANP